jgi:hypothetical protein
LASIGKKLNCDAHTQIIYFLLKADATLTNADLTVILSAGGIVQGLSNLLGMLVHKAKVS